MSRPWPRSLEANFMSTALTLGLTVRPSSIALCVGGRINGVCTAHYKLLAGPPLTRQCHWKSCSLRGSWLLWRWLSCKTAATRSPRWPGWPPSCGSRGTSMKVSSHAVRDVPYFGRAVFWERFSSLRCCWQPLFSTGITWRETVWRGGSLTAWTCLPIWQDRSWLGPARAG